MQKYTNITRKNTCPWNMCFSNFHPKLMSWTFLSKWCKLPAHCRKCLWFLVPLTTENVCDFWSQSQGERGNHRCGLYTDPKKNFYKLNIMRPCQEDIYKNLSNNITETSKKSRRYFQRNLLFSFMHLDFHLSYFLGKKNEPHYKNIFPKSYLRTPFLFKDVVKWLEIKESGRSKLRAMPSPSGMGSSFPKLGVCSSLFLWRCRVLTSHGDLLQSCWLFLKSYPLRLTPETKCHPLGKCLQGPKICTNDSKNPFVQKSPLEISGI